MDGDSASDDRSEGAKSPNSPMNCLSPATSKNVLNSLEFSSAIKGKEKLLSPAARKKEIRNNDAILTNSKKDTLSEENIEQKDCFVDQGIASPSILRQKTARHKRTISELSRTAAALISPMRPPFSDGYYPFSPFSENVSFSPASNGQKIDTDTNSKFKILNFDAQLYGSVIEKKKQKKINCGSSSVSKKRLSNNRNRIKVSLVYKISRLIIYSLFKC